MPHIPDIRSAKYEEQLPGVIPYEYINFGLFVFDGPRSNSAELDSRNPSFNRYERPCERPYHVWFDLMFGIRLSECHRAGPAHARRRGRK